MVKIFIPSIAKTMNNDVLLLGIIFSGYRIKFDPHILCLNSLH